MGDNMIARRGFIKSASMAAIASAAPGIFGGAGQAEKVPNSTGDEPAKLKAPAGACDCHHHIYDAARFPPAQPGGTITPDARVEASRMLQTGRRERRDNVVPPLAYVTANRVTLDAIAKLAPDTGRREHRRPSITDAELNQADSGGIRGIRLAL